VRIAPSGAARLAMEHQREQAPHLRLLREQCHDQSAEIDRLGGEAAQAGIAASHIVPAAAISGIDRLQHCVQPGGKLVRLRWLERYAGLADAGFRPRQSPRHCRRADAEGGSDARGIEPEHSLQHQRRADRSIDRGMGAGEQQLQPLVCQA
jgi:hypothetical protein